MNLCVDSEIKRLSGKGSGFSDGDLATAMFDKPKSFAVDLKGNVYVADKGNLAIRKISKSGIITSITNFQKFFVLIPLFSPKVRYSFAVSAS